MPKFAKVYVGYFFIQILYSRNNFLDQFFNLSWGMTCLQNVFFDVDFLIYFFYFINLLNLVFQLFLLNPA